MTLRLLVFALVITVGGIACAGTCQTDDPLPWDYEAWGSTDDDLVPTTAHYSTNEVLSLDYTVDGQAYRAVWNVSPNEFANGVNRKRCK